MDGKLFLKGACLYHVPLQRYVWSKFKVGPKKRFFAPPPARGGTCPGELGLNFSNSNHKWICVQVRLRFIQWHRRLGVKKEERRKKEKVTAVKYKPFSIAMPCGLITDWIIFTNIGNNTHRDMERDSGCFFLYKLTRVVLDIGPSNGLL